MRLDEWLVNNKIVRSRSNAVRTIKLGLVRVNDNVCSKPSYSVKTTDRVILDNESVFVSRAQLKLAKANKKLGIVLHKRYILDIGSSTGGFTRHALDEGAVAVIAVDVGTDQMVPELAADERVELHEKTDFRDMTELSHDIDVVVIDVSFISIRMILNHILTLPQLKNADIIAMVKPQFEADAKQKNKGVVKNSTIRRQILKEFEGWCRGKFVILNKCDSEVAGSKGNIERFYHLRISK